MILIPYKFRCMKHCHTISMLENSIFFKTNDTVLSLFHYNIGTIVYFTVTKLMYVPIYLNIFLDT